MKVIQENNVTYSLSLRSQTGPEVRSVPAEEIALKGIGTLYIVGDEIYFGKKGKWFRVNVGDVELVKDMNDRKISVVLNFLAPSMKQIEIVLESDNHSHLRALKHILNIYNVYMQGKRGGESHGG